MSMPELDRDQPVPAGGNKLLNASIAEIVRTSRPTGSQMGLFEDRSQYS